MSSPKLLDQVRTVARLKHFSLRTEQAYVGWIRRFILFHNKRRPEKCESNYKCNQKALSKLLHREGRDRTQAR